MPEALFQCYPLDSSYSLVMPNNYIIGSDTDSEEVILKKIASARETLKQIAGEILRKERVYRVHEGALAGVKSYAANAGFNRFARSARPFFATDRCNGCGLCAQRCPASAISMKDGKPVWKAQCYQCLRCINAWPQAGHPVWQRHRRAAAGIPFGPIFLWRKKPDRPAGSETVRTDFHGRYAGADILRTCSSWCLPRIGYRR